MQEILDANYSITKYLRPEVHEEIKAIEEKIILSYNMYEDASEKHMILCTQDVLLMDQNNLTPQEFFEHNEERKQIGNLMNVIYNDVEKVIEKKLIDIKNKELTVGKENNCRTFLKICVDIKCFLRYQCI